jgi:hypothetical protein
MLYFLKVIGRPCGLTCSLKFCLGCLKIKIETNELATLITYNFLDLWEGLFYMMLDMTPAAFLSIPHPGGVWPLRWHGCFLYARYSEEPASIPMTLVPASNFTHQEIIQARSPNE